MSGRSTKYDSILTSHMSGVVQSNGTSERYRELARIQSYFHCNQHGGKKYEWDGRVAPRDMGEQIQFESSHFTPGVTEQGDKIPLKYRKPTAPFYLAQAIVEQFTDLLFSGDRGPRIIVRNDDVSQDFLRGIEDICSLWDTWAEARDLGGSTGSVAVGFHFDGGVPKIEVFDSKNCTPGFVSPRSFSLSSIEIRYRYESEEMQPVLDKATGNYSEMPATVLRWYRRVINEHLDITFSNPIYDENTQPEFSEIKRVEHGFGFCPVVWVQNLRCRGNVDGRADYCGAMDLFDEIDQILSQACKGTKYNADPTTHVASDLEVETLKMGSFDAVHTESKGKVSLVEMSGESIAIALSVVERLRQYAQVVCRCVIDLPQSNDRDRVTASEIRRHDFSMYARAGRLRKSYEQGIVRLLVLICRAAYSLNESKQVILENGESEIIKQVLVMPDGVPVLPSRDNPKIQIEWGRYSMPSPQDMKVIVDALVSARVGKLIDLETAIEILSPYLKHKDPSDLVKILKKEAAEEEYAMTGPFPGPDESEK